MKKLNRKVKAQQNSFHYWVVLFFFNITMSGLMAQNIIYPSDAGVVNVKNAPYNAKGDGTTDDTQAIQQAIVDNLNSHAIIYFPNGTYLVSSTLKWHNGDYSSWSGGWGAYLSLQGQSRAGTIIKLKANTFTSITSPQPVIMTGSRDDQGAYNDTNGEGNQAFENSILNMTIDVGTGNPGAIAVDYQVSNWGVMREVTIKSSDAGKAGFCGISMLRRDNGPGMIENVSVDGFQYGIRVGQEIAQFTLENISLSSQSIVGIEDIEGVLAIRKLTSVNTVPAIIASKQALLDIIEANLTGGSSANSAIEYVDDASRGYLRGITSSGYGSALKHRGTVVAGSSVTEWVSDAVLKLNPTTKLSLNLPIEETPTYFDETLSNWASVGNASGGSDMVAIQAAMNSGKSTVYFPRGFYFRVTGSITVPASVKHIIGVGAVIKSMNDMGGQAIFKFVGGTSSDQTILERFELTSDNGYIVEHASARTIVMKDLGVNGGNAYKNEPGAGKLFIDDVVSKGWFFNGAQSIWARQFDTEGDITYATNNGAKLWILGFKTENSETVVETRNGGSTEIFGGFTYTFGDRGKPAFINSGSNLSVSFCGTTYMNPGVYSTIVSETSGATTTTLPIGSTYGGRTYSVPMYIGEAAPATVQYRINAGGGADGLFSGDQYGWGSNTGTYFTTDPIDVSGVTDPAPQSIYQSELDDMGGAGSYFTYWMPYLKANNVYKVRLHFVERYYTVANGRKFDVTISGNKVLSNFDIFADAGAKNKAIIKEFDAVANADGQIIIVFTSVVDRALVNGIEILGVGTASSLANGNGTVVMEKWTGVTGTAIANNNFNTTPNTTYDLTKLEIPVDADDNYAVRIRGYIIPSATAAYNLYIASDDEGQLWLSTNDQPANISKIAWVSTWTNSQEWTKETNQKSASTNLTGGQKYYFEALVKEGNGGDNLAIGWTSPYITSITIPSGLNINSFTENQAPSCSITSPANNASFADPASITINATAADVDGTVSKVDFYNGTTLLGIDNTSPYSYSWTGVEAGTYSLTVNATDNDGSVTSSSAVNVMVSAVISDTGTGLTGEYYDNNDLTNLMVTRVDPTIDFWWGDGSPDPSIWVETFSTRWTGQIQPKYSETYTFYINSDNGRRLWINNQLIIDKWLNDWNVEYSGTITLVAGQKYDIKMEYFEESGGAGINFSWQSASQAKEIVPQLQLYPAVINTSPTVYGSSLKSAFADLDATEIANATEDAIQIYPNPTSGIVYIKSSKDINNVSIVDMMGRTVLVKQSHEKMLDLSMLPKGIYFVRVTTIDNSSITNKVIIR